MVWARHEDRGTTLSNQVLPMAAARKKINRKTQEEMEGWCETNHIDKKRNHG